jgi:NTE family protein
MNLLFVDRKSLRPDSRQVFLLDIRVMLILALVMASTTLTSCARYGKIKNLPITSSQTAKGTYSIFHHGETNLSNDITVVLAFSGGGSRAAALSYGLLTALRDTTVRLDGVPKRLLDEVDFVSAVSGGSFTAAYYGLYGDRIFTDFESDFLRYNLNSNLIQGLLRPRTWLSMNGRTEMAIRLYDDHVFRGATFADFNREGAPMILINASDLGGGTRFSFTQDYFDLLCSDLSEYPVSRAVAASSAVPVLFNPVVLKNHTGCANESLEYIKQVTANKNLPIIQQTIHGFKRYGDKEKHPFIHLVDGGITGNLGLGAFYEIIEASGGGSRFVELAGLKPHSKIVVISVNASKRPRGDIDQTRKLPSISKTISAITRTQLYRYNMAVLQLSEQYLKQWAHELSGGGNPIESYFIKLDLNTISDPVNKKKLEEIPTNFHLKEDQVNRLISAGRELLFENAEFKRFMAAFEN